MRNLKLEIEYEGTNYCGWQVQTRNKKKKSIQQVIEVALSKILQERIRLIGSGRTDAGVHASGQVANFTTNSDIDTQKLQRALNGLLPEDIVIKKLEKERAGFHSRFDAKSKLYRYAILNRKYPSAFLRNRVYFCCYPLDVRLMRQEAKVLVGRHNFRAFQTSDKKERDPVKTIKKINILREGDFIYVDIQADGFLYNMARSIAGTLIEIGRGKIPPGALKKILLLRNRKFSGPNLPACGLTLIKVEY